PMVRAAMAFALQKLGKNYVSRLVEFLDSPKLAPQVSEYFIELGSTVAPALVAHLQDPSPAIRGNTAQVIGAIGDGSSLTALQPLTQDRDRDVVEAANRAIERINLRTEAPRSTPKSELPTAKTSNVNVTATR